MWWWCQGHGKTLISGLKIARRVKATGNLLCISSQQRVIQSYIKRLPYCSRHVPMAICSSSTKNWGWVVAWSSCLNGSSIPMQAPTPDANLADGKPNRSSSLLHPCFVEASPTIWIMLEKWIEPKPSCQSSATFIVCSTWILYCKWGMLQMRRTGACKTLLLDVVVPDAHQIDHSYVCAWAQYRPISVHYSRFMSWWAVTWRTSKDDRPVKIGGGGEGVGGGGFLPWTIQ